MVRYIFKAMHLILDCFHYWDRTDKSVSPEGEIVDDVKTFYAVYPLEIEIDSIKAITPSIGPNDVKNLSDVKNGASYSRIYTDCIGTFDINMPFNKLQKVWREAKEKQNKEMLMLIKN